MDVTNASPDIDCAVLQPPTAFDLVLFDLDGTLIDPAGGITGGIAHALRTLAMPVPDDAGLMAMIGPKLADALVTIAGVPEESVAETIAVYRAWYREHGMGMSTVYPGTRELLAQLKHDGMHLAVATQKPEPLAVELLGIHGLAEYFSVIRGSNADETLMPGDPGYRAGKAEIIAAAISAVSATSLAKPSNAIMVGDRHQDIRGAHSNGLDCIGVAWGFAADGELETAGVAAVVHSTQELAAELVQPSWLASTTATTSAKEAGHGTV